MYPVPVAQCGSCEVNTVSHALRGPAFAIWRTNGSSWVCFGVMSATLDYKLQILGFKMGLNTNISAHRSTNYRGKMKSGSMGPSAEKSNQKQPTSKPPAGHTPPADHQQPDSNPPADPADNQTPEITPRGAACAFGHGGRL